MADHHYTPAQDGPIARVMQDLEGLNCESRVARLIVDDAFLNYAVPELDETFEADGRSLLDLQPPPLFSRTGLPANYVYKNSAQSKIQEVQDPRTGEINMRFVNRSREQHYGAQVIGHQHSPGDVPSEPTKQVKERMKRLKEPLIQKLRNVRAVKLGADVDLCRTASLATRLAAVHPDARGTARDHGQPHLHGDSGIRYRSRPILEVLLSVRIRPVRRSKRPAVPAHLLLPPRR